jgi:hypothetical protein
MAKRHQAILGLLLVSLVVLMMGLARFKRSHAPNGSREEPQVPLIGGALDLLDRSGRRTLRIVEAGGKLTSANLDISRRTLVAIPSKPGVLFATVRKPGGQEQFAFIVLLKYGPRIDSFDFTSPTRAPDPDCTLDFFGRWGETKAVFALNGTRISVVYRIELDDALSTVTKESLEAGGNPVDVASGQLFLVDLTTVPTVYRQLKVQMPPIPAKLETEQDAERAAEAIRQSLRGQRADLEAYLR